MIVTGKANAVSMINGMIVGLVAITPAAGFVNGYGAMIIGLVAGVIVWFSLNKLNKTALRELWKELFSVSPRAQLRRHLMIPILAYRLQERA